VISESGIILKTLSRYIARPHNFFELFSEEKSKEITINPKQIFKINTSKMDLQKLNKMGRKFITDALKPQYSKLNKLNETMFRKELQRMLDLYEYKIKHTTRTIKSYENRLKYLEKKKPTKRQRINLEKIENAKRRKEKQEKYDKIERELQTLHIEISRLNKDLENIEFSIPEDVKRLEFYRKITKRISLQGIGYIFLHNTIPLQ
jgi:paraquat-inducible protein B